ncbi:pentatricopeptide repeat-containing protein At1g20230-like [Ananas comosus]|uniref:Pentatricopeptide repeat-containing protein At1g20230-like n=1 Tax=Ananas comosus TaxID=4615 RepID=A0A6P5EN53_ANACO|nr:pentatricopeptide repeat-containing protein At1g20230-like [Ananas comosus]
MVRSPTVSCRSSSLLLFIRSLPLPPDPFLLPSTFKACAALRSLRSARQLHCIAAVSGLSSDPFVQSALVHAYLKCDSLRDAHRVFDRMAPRTVVPWSAIIAGYAAAGRVHESTNLLQDMQTAGVPPNLITWNGLIAGFSLSLSLSREAPAKRREPAAGRGFAAEATRGGLRVRLLLVV